MSKVVNEAKIKNKFVVRIRELLEHRAFWLYLLVDEAEKRGLDPEDFASAAVTRCGLSQGSDLVKQGGTKSLKGLRKTLFTRAARWVFEMDLVESTDDTLTISSFFFVTGSALGYATPLIVDLFRGSGMLTLSAWRTTFVIYIVIGVTLLLIPAFTIQEKDYVHSIRPSITLSESLKHAFSNKHFRVVTLGQLLEGTGMAFFQACILYYVTSLMGLPETYSC